jgi:pantoate--beta-alanine ligase
VLYRALTTARVAFKEGERNAEHLRRIVAEAIAGEPLARLQYVSCAHPDTLEELDTITDRALLSLAVFLGQTRLIDNTIVKVNETSINSS